MLAFCAWGPLPEGGRGAAPPDFGGKFFNTFRPPPPILAGFVVKCLNYIIKFLEMRE